MSPLALYRLARRKLHVRLVSSMRKKRRAFLAMRVDKPPRFDERNSVDRFRRENGLR
jgi:hypothetical protein